MDGPRLEQRRADCTVVELDGRVSIFNPDTKTVHTLSATATAVWQQLEVSQELDELVRGIAGRYGTAVEQVREDVVAVLRTLVAAGVVVDESDPGR